LPPPLGSRAAAGRTGLALAVAVFSAASSFLLSAATAPIVVLTPTDRREIAPVTRGEAELVPLDALLAGARVSLTSDSRAGSVKLRLEGREVTLYDRKSVFSVGGDLRLLSSPALLESGRWLVPADSASRVLAPLLGVRVDWRGPSRVLLIGPVTLPRIEVSHVLGPDSVRVTLEASERVPFRIGQEAGRVTVDVLRDVVETPFQQEKLTGGIVDRMQFLGGRDNAFVVWLGKRFQEFKASEQDSPPRLVLEFRAAPLTAAESPSAAPPSPGLPEATHLATIVIDPGHGGAEVGAMGPGGTLEKDVTLAIARKLRASLAGGLGLQAFLTRERDQELPLDERTAVANNYKADLFVSIHANASRSQGARGSEVYFLSQRASDDESRRLALAEGGEPVAAPASGSSELSMILWDMAQAEHLQESSALATRIQEELAEVTGSQGRGIKQAPFRVLVGAAMPAVLVEVAFISNADEERLLTSDSYQNQVVAALVRGIAKFQGEHQQRAGSAPARPSGRAPIG
jgi:N-acetylmuramoyl-L-alanine amidase